MSIFKLIPACKDYLWGGNKIREEFGVEFDGNPLAESWELSVHPDGPSVISTGEFEGMSFRNYIQKFGVAAMGSACEKFEDFPILIKFIDAKDNLSVQVHPDNEFALENEGQYGKTETWYIVDAKEGAGIYYGVKKAMTEEEFAAHIADNTILDYLNFQKVRPGEMYFIKAGTLHAIGEGCLIAEIQQNSNVTYRVYDFGRVGADGKPRELHIEKAKKVSNLKPVYGGYSFGNHLADCEYFTVDDLSVMGSKVVEADETSFKSILVLDGEGSIRLEETGEIVDFKKGDSIFISAGSNRAVICGTLRGIMTYIS